MILCTTKTKLILLCMIGRIIKSFLIKVMVSYNLINNGEDKDKDNITY